MKKCFDESKYLSLQREKILERTKMFDTLYLEFGGKLIDDYHASRVLPGFRPDLKVSLLQELKDDAEVILCVSARAIQAKKERADYGITYDEDAIRLIAKLLLAGVKVCAAVVTMYEGQPLADAFAKKVTSVFNLPVYFYPLIEGYPTNVEKIVSEEGFGKNPYIPTTKSLVVVTAPGPCSGKMATALSQVYHEVAAGKNTGYAKFETFPIWNLPVEHPVNIAYEAATADLGDVNMIDHFHKEKYGEEVTNYNRDLEAFPILRDILTKISKNHSCPYFSPTDMGVNMAGLCITDDEGVRKASKAEIVRRLKKAEKELAEGKTTPEVVERIERLLYEI